MSIPNDGSKERTISHMNKDHASDLSAILRHKLGVVSHGSPMLEDISLSSLTILANGATHVVPVSPPMETWADRRSRLVEMTHAARLSLGINSEGKPIVVRKFVGPTGFGAVVAAGVVFYFACYAAVKGGWVEEGRKGWEAVEGTGFPGGAEGFRRLVGRMFLPVLGIHVGECWWLDWSRLSRFGVRRGGGLWWKWIGRCFVEGFTTFGGFDEVVEGEVKRE